MERMGCVYALRDPDTCLFRYVGKTVQANPLRRKSQHFKASEKTKTPKRDWIRKLKKQGKLPVFEILESPPLEALDAREIYFIKYYRDLGHPLLNLTPGGDGLPRGFKWSEDQKVKLKGRTPWNKGKEHPTARGKHSPEFIEKMKEGMAAKVAASGGKHWNEGRPTSEKQKAAMKEIGKRTKGRPSPFKGIERPESVKVKISKGLTDKTFSEASKKKMSESHKGQKRSPEALEKYKATMSSKENAFNKGISHSEETRAKMRAAWERRRARGDVVWNKGKEHSEEQKKKLKVAWMKRRDNSSALLILHTSV